MTQTYLITGGAGFIGSHLCDRLVAHGHRVLVLDDLSTGTLDNLAQHAGNDRVQVTVGCVSDRDRTAPLVAQADGIFHLAAVVGVAKVMESPLTTIETGARGMDMVMNLAAQRSLPTVFTSTSEVYGKSNALPLREDGDIVFGPAHRLRWSYACGKALDEYLALAFHRERELPVKVVRLFNTSGPRQSSQFGMVLPRFISRALRNLPIPVYGDGSHTRCFTNVHDVVWALHRLMHTDAASGQVFNIGNDAPISVLDLAHLVRDHLGSASEVQFVPFKAVYDADFEETADRLPDLSRAHAMIGFEPRTPLLQTIDEIVRHGVADI